MKKAALFVLICLSCFVLSAQQIDSLIMKNAEQRSTEKLYLHFDKSTYATGETIWFKVYGMQGIYPAESRNVYADWSNEKGELIYRSVLPMVDGTASGQVEIPDGYKGNFLHVRAYTRWMLNFDSAFLYNKDIRIAGKTRQPATSTAPAYELNFFPEGGDILAGVSNRIAFKVNDQWGLPATLRGVIKDGKGKIIDSLRVVHDGLGDVHLRPAPGDRFKAEWVDEKGGKHSTDLPELKTTGVSLQVGMVPNRRNFSITGVGYSGLVHVVGTMNKFMVFKVSKDLSQGPLQSAVPVNNLPSGILTITVFDNAWRPLAERITFINNGDYLFEPEMNVEHWGLSKRARNEVSITIPDSIVANLSVAVTDAAIDHDSSDHILSHLLLGGDLKGYIHEPAWYFRGDMSAKERILDFVMLTHGWRRINWEAVVSNNFPALPYAKDTAWLSLSGRARGVDPARLRDPGSIYLIVKQPDGGPQIFTMPIQKDGSFRDPSLILFDTAQVYYQFSRKDEMGAAVVNFMEDRLPSFSKNINAAGWIPFDPADTAGVGYHLQWADEESSVRKFNQLQTLQGVTVRSTKKSPLEEMDEKYTSGLFSFGDAIQFDLVNDPFAASRLSIFDYLQGKVAGLQITGGGAQTSLSWRGGSPQLYLDEMQTDASMMSSVNVSDIAYVKVFRPPFMGAFGGGAGGAIAVYTRRGSDQKTEPGKGLAAIKVAGYSITREFYSPNYASFVRENESRDLRTTLYWNPSVLLSPQQRTITLKFYNNDISNAFRVVIEGMTTDGRLAHIEQLME